MNKLKYYLFYIIISLIISYSNRQVKTNNNYIDINMYLHFLSSTSLLEVPSCTCSCDVIIGTLTSMTMFSLCNRVTLCGLASSRLLHGLIDRIKTSHSFKHGYNTGDGVVLYALISPQWPMHVLHTSAILFPAMLPIFQGQLAVFEIFVTMQGFENWASKAVQAWWSWCVSWGRRA